MQIILLVKDPFYFSSYSFDAFLSGGFQVSVCPNAFFVPKTPRVFSPRKQTFDEVFSFFAFTYNKHKKGEGLLLTLPGFFGEQKIIYLEESRTLPTLRRFR